MNSDTEDTTPSFFTGRERRKPELNIAPLIDMVFILLIFFLVTTTFSREAGVDVNKPRASTARTLPRENIMIAITGNGSIHIHNRRVNLNTLGSIVGEILKSRPMSSVIIIADRASHTGRVVEVMDECKKAGAKRISLAALEE